MTDLHWRPAAALVCAGGDPPPLAWARPWLAAAGRIVCADSGWRVCRDCGLRPELVIGDLDSLTEEECSELSREGIPVQRFPVDKDQSDLQLALETLALSYQGEVDVVAALGGRLDHLLFNVCSVLEAALQLGLQPRLVSHDTLVVPLRASQSIALHELTGCTASLLPLSAKLEGLTLQGFRYPLQGESLTRSATRGLSNVVESATARLQLEKGEGLLILTRQEPRPPARQ